MEGESGKVVVAQFPIGDAHLWVQADGVTAHAMSSSPVRMILTVADLDGVFQQALAAGGTLVAPISGDYGWRVGRIADPSGHHWEIGRPHQA